MILPAILAAVLTALAALSVWASQHGLTPRTTSTTGAEQ